MNSGGSFLGWVLGGVVLLSAVGVALGLLLCLAAVVFSV